MAHPLPGASHGSKPKLFDQESVVAGVSPAECAAGTAASTSVENASRVRSQSFITRADAREARGPWSLLCSER
jgi:hypothetical protein